MKKLSFLLSLLLLLPLASSCAKPANSRSASFFLMDTVISVTLYGTDEKTAGELLDGCRELLSELDALWARNREGSDAARINSSADGIPDADPRTVALIRTARSVSMVTGGAFDLTVAPLVDLWELCGERDSLPAEAELSACLARVGWDRVTAEDTTVGKTAPDVSVDFGGIGKGAAARILLDYLREGGTSGGLISFGSNVAVFGERPGGGNFRIGIRNPKDESATVGTLLLSPGQILSVSGDYERYVEIGGRRYHHILDPLTGYPSGSGLSSVAVICEDGAIADALSTALMVMGYEKSMELYREGLIAFEALFIFPDGTLAHTPGLSGSFLPAEK